MTSQWLKPVQPPCPGTASRSPATRSMVGLPKRQTTTPTPCCASLHSSLTHCPRDQASAARLTVPTRYCNYQTRTKSPGGVPSTSCPLELQKCNWCHIQYRLNVPDFHAKVHSLIQSGTLTHPVQIQYLVTTSSLCQNQSHYQFSR